jgi:Fur family ferric uptake transcriptional regulator
MDFNSFFTENHIKKTLGRVKILEILVEQKEAIDAEKIFEICSEKNLKIDLSTIYRTLELYFNRGIVEKYDFGDGKYSYMLKKAKHKHVLECSLCHKEIEIDCPMQQLEESIRSKTGFILFEHEIDPKIKGICEECSKKRKK